MIRAVPLAVMAATITAGAIMSMRDGPTPKHKPSVVADMPPRPSGRPHLNVCPLRYGIAADIEVAWK